MLINPELDNLNDLVFYLDHQNNHHLKYLYFLENVMLYCFDHSTRIKSKEKMYFYFLLYHSNFHYEKNIFLFSFFSYIIIYVNLEVTGSSIDLEVWFRLAGAHYQKSGD